MELIQINKFAKLHNGEDVFFCKTDYLSSLFDRLADHHKPSILITGNSDYPITDEMAGRAPKCIKKWFAQNADTGNQLVVGIPMGIENHENCVLDGHGKGWESAKKKVEVLSSFTSVEPTKDVYANFSLNTHHSRKAVHGICELLDFATTKISLDHAEINNRSYKDYVDDILDHRMVVCPRGNGIDCHRVWETLYLGRVPIIKKERAMRYFEELPIVFLDDWAQLYNLHFLNDRYEAVKKNSTEILDFVKWEEVIGGNSVRTN